MKGSLDWIIDRKDWRRFAISIRQQFDQHRQETDPQKIDKLVKATQLLLWRYRHPEPYKCNLLCAMIIIYYFLDPTAPGGVMWDREARLPKEICEKGFGKGVLDTY